MRSTKRTQHISKTLSLLLLPLFALGMIWTGLSMGCQVSSACASGTDQALGIVAPYIGWGGLVLLLLSPCIVLAWLVMTHSETHVLVYKIYTGLTVTGLALCVLLYTLDYFFDPPEQWSLFVVDGQTLVFSAFAGVVFAYPLSWLLAWLVRYIQRKLR